MGKYDAVVANLPKLIGSPEEERSSKHHDKVASFKQALLQSDGYKQHASFLASLYVDLRDEKEEMEETVSELNVRLDAVIALMREQFEAEGINSLRLDTGERVDIGYEPVGKVVDRDKLRLWCVAQGLENKLSLPPATLTSLLKELLLQGATEPDGVEAYARVKVRLNRG